MLGTLKITGAQAHTHRGGGMKTKRKRIAGRPRTISGRSIIPIVDITRIRVSQGFIISIEPVALLVPGEDETLCFQLKKGVFTEGSEEAEIAELLSEK
jgi:hypothetical protein